MVPLVYLTSKKRKKKVGVETRDWLHFYGSYESGEYTALLRVARVRSHLLWLKKKKHQTFIVTQKKKLKLRGLLDTVLALVDITENRINSYSYGK